VLAAVRKLHLFIIAYW